MGMSIETLFASSVSDLRGNIMGTDVAGDEVLGPKFR